MRNERLHLLDPSLGGSISNHKLIFEEKRLQGHTFFEPFSGINRVAAGQFFTSEMGDGNSWKRYLHLE